MEFRLPEKPEDVTEDAEGFLFGASQPDTDALYTQIDGTFLPATTMRLPIRLLQPSPAGALDRLSEHAKYIADREVFEVLYFLVE
jgi:hypothetical protein